MKKTLLSITTMILILICFYYAYMYYNGPKIIKGIVAKSIDENGKAIDIASEFSPEDTIYFSAKSNRFWIKNAQIVWYKDKLKTENRILVEDDIMKSDRGYFSSKLSAPKGLEEGYYIVCIYVAGKDIIETRTDFYVKDKNI